MRFGSKWINWIKGCICPCSLSMLINGSRTQDFIMERGLCQGDPISPLLFIIAIEGFACLMKNATDGSLFHPATIC